MVEPHVKKIRTESGSSAAYYIKRIRFCAILQLCCHHQPQFTFIINKLGLCEYRDEDLSQYWNLGDTLS